MPNRSWIVLDGVNFISGQRLFGTVFVEVATPFYAHDLICTVVGTEEASFDKMVSDPSKNPRNNSNDLVKKRFEQVIQFLTQKIVVHTQSGLLPPGKYTFPFEYLIPDLPSAITVNNKAKKAKATEAEDYHIKIQYFMTATINAMESQNTLQTQVPVPIVERTPINPNAYQIHREIKPTEKSFMQCKGFLQMKTSLPKDAFHAGERMKICLEINNTSVKAIDKTVFELLQIIEFKNVSGEKERKEKVLKSQTNPTGYDPLFWGTRDLYFDLPDNLTPSSKGKDLTQVNYVLRSTANIMLAADLTYSCPVYITKPEFAGHPLPTGPFVQNFRPRYIKDSEVEACMGCAVRFSMLKRKHHCRQCLKIFCSACCNKTKDLKSCGYKGPETVCLVCFNKKN